MSEAHEIQKAGIVVLVTKFGVRSQDPTVEPKHRGRLMQIMGCHSIRQARRLVALAANRAQLSDDRLQEIRREDGQHYLELVDASERVVDYDG